MPGRRETHISIADLDVDRANRADGRREIAGVVLRAEPNLRIEVVFGLHGATACARFFVAEAGPDTLRAQRQAAFARTFTTATMADLLARGLAAELSRHEAG